MVDAQFSKLRGTVRRPRWRTFVKTICQEQLYPPPPCSRPELILPLLSVCRKSPALLKVVAEPTEKGKLVQPSFLEGDVATASSLAVARWVENESFGLVSDFDPATFLR